MIILNMGVPRSGTVWAFNVIRSIVARKPVDFVTQNANSPTEVDAAITNLQPDSNLILHFHDFTPNAQQLANRPDVVSFCNYRDPRDVVVSQMRLHEVDFDSATRMTVAAYQIFQAALQIPRMMLIPYPHLVEHPEPLVFQMALRLGEFLDLRSVKQITERTSAGQHEKIMQEVNRTGDESVDRPIGSAFTGKRSIRYDTSSLITDRHIQSGKSGRWKNELPPDQQNEVNRVFANIIRSLGFEAAGD